MTKLMDKGREDAFEGQGRAIIWTKQSDRQMFDTEYLIPPICNVSRSIKRPSRSHEFIHFGISLAFIDLLKIQISFH